MKKKLFMILVGLFITIIASTVTSYLGVLVIGEQEEGTKHINESINNNVYLIFLPLLFSPVVEELIFRKWVPNVFSDVLGRKKSILFSNILFAMCHFTINLIPFFINGLIYSYFYEKSKDIKVPIIIHVLYNLIVLIFTFML